MKKFAVTIGQTAKGDLVVVDGPSADVGALKASLEKLVVAGGSQGKGKETIENALILHSVRGIIKRRKNLPAIKKLAAHTKKVAAEKAKAEAEAAAEAAEVAAEQAAEAAEEASEEAAEAAEERDQD